tara:strand:+ start:8699 stop:10381 length:1683 start_codon:yes stop_codon:yes gene_type:complete
MLAPVVISVYTRLTHFQRSIQALKKNNLSPHTHLVIYSDGASRKEHQEAVNAVREFAHRIKGFKRVTVIERAFNYGGVRNVHEGLKQVVKVFKKAVCIEDDIEVAPGFLAFMNGALDHYRDNLNVVSISGYSPPLLGVGEYLEKDFFTLNRFSGWGCGVYERTMDWLATKISKEEFYSVKDENVLREFGEDLLPMVRREVAGELDAADVRCMFRQSIQNVATIYPRYSLAQNNGHDGSGFHCGISNRFRHKQLWEKTENFIFDNDTKVDKRIKSENQDFRAFRGNYVKLKTIFNVEQSKEVSQILLDEYFDKAYQQLIKAKSSKPIVRENIIAIFSTPRVGSTWLCRLLKTRFGESISNEWLHRRFVERFLADHKASNAKDYLKLIRDYAFPNEKIQALHIHVNQHRYWQVEHNINLLEFFSFTDIYYMQRQDFFAQIFSFAVANETGLWGDELVQKANISEKFCLSVNQKMFEKAEKALANEFTYYTEYLKDYVSTVIDYKLLVSEPNAFISKYFSKFPQLSSKEFEANLLRVKIEKSFVDTKARAVLEDYYHQKALTV